MDVLHTLVRTCLKNAGIPQKPLESPAEVTIYYNDRWDIDNHAILGKAIVDAMKGWVLTDDNRKHFVAVSHRFWDGDEILVRVKEMNVKGDIATLGDIDAVLNACGEGYVDHGDTIKRLLTQYRDALLEKEVDG